MRIGAARALFARFTLAAAVAAGLAACGYSPNPQSGTLMCGPNASCPEGYSCRAQYCWRDSDITGAGGSAGGPAGTGGRGGSGGGPGGAGGTGGATSRTKFVGTWTFVAPAKRTRVCPGVNESVDWSDFFEVTNGTVGALAAFYYCDWHLDVNAAGTATSIRLSPSQTCTKPDPDDPTITYTWVGESFTLTTTDGRTGTIDASLPYDYTTSAGSGHCTMRFTGPVTKN
jgi:hypothetical protein